MQRFETIKSLQTSTLPVGDIVEVFGEFIEGDVPVMTGKVVSKDTVTSNRTVTLENGNKVEIYPTSTDATKAYVDGAINKFHTDPAVPYVANIVIDKMTDKVTKDGITYVPNTVPFTTVDWATDASKFENIEKASIMFRQGKFLLTESVDNNYFSLVNKKTGSAIARFADNSNEADAHLFLLPFEVRRDSHSLISTAGTRNGRTDIAARTNGYSDYIYQFFDSAYQREAFKIGFDTNPSRRDGTRKNGTGGGGQLPPEKDRYAFDDALHIPSNISGSRTDYAQHVKFPALYATFEQGVGVKRRTRGQYGYQWNYGESNTNTYIECLETTHKLIEFDSKGTVIGGINKLPISFPYTTDYLVTNNVSGTGFNAGTSIALYKPNVNNSNPFIIKLVKSGFIKLISIKLNIFSDGNVPFYFIGLRQVAGSDPIVIGSDLANLPSNLTVTIEKDSGGYVLNILGTSGSTYRVSASIEIN